MDTATDSALYCLILSCQALIVLFVVVKKRRANPQANRDVLTMMLEGRDPQSGEGLSDDTIVYNVCPSALSFILG